MSSFQNDVTAEERLNTVNAAPYISLITLQILLLEPVAERILRYYSHTFNHTSKN
jgi:hypothetical protein